MGPFALPIALVVISGAALILSYALIKPALFIVILSSMGLSIFFRCLKPAYARHVGGEPVLLAFGLPIAAWVTPNAWLLYGVILAAMLFIARKPGRAAPTYLFALLLLPGLDQSMSIGSLKLFEFGVHDALAVGAAVRVAMQPGGSAARKSLDLPFIGVLLLLVTATARDTSITNFVRVLVNTGLDCALPYYIVSRGVRTMDDLRLCMVYVAGASAVLSIILMYEAHASWPLYNVLYDRYGIYIQMMLKSRGGVLRAGGPFIESTSMAMVLVFCFFATWLSRPTFRSSLYYYAMLVLLLGGMTAPQSRGAWIGLLIGMTAADIYRRRIGSAVTRGGMIVGALLLLVALAPMSPYLSETMGLSGGSTDTAQYRQRLFDRGMEEFAKSPIVGYSSPEILIHLADLRQGEGIVDFVNTYIFVALVSGLIGLTIFIGSFLIYLGQLWGCRGRLRADNPDIDCAAFIFAGLITPMEMLIFTSFGGRPELFVFVFFALATAAVGIIARTRSRRPAPPSPTATQPTPSPAVARDDAGQHQRDPEVSADTCVVAVPN